MVFIRNINKMFGKMEKRNSGGKKGKRDQKTAKKTK